jgi:hypothetical protein
MDHGILAIWYDLPEAGRQAYLDWLHQVHLPEVLARPGFAWAAHYQITGAGAAMDALHERFARADDDDLGTGKDFLILIGAPSPQVFFHPRIDQVTFEDQATTQAMMARRQGARASVFVEQAAVTGPEIGARPAGACPGPAIQMGSFRVKRPEDEWDLSAWYAQYRLPAMSAMAGAIATRKLVSLAGWARHAVLYEFTSLEARQAHFQNHESLGLDAAEWTSKIVNYTIHSPGSPHIGRRLWPPVAAGTTGLWPPVAAGTTD